MNHTVETLATAIEIQGRHLVRTYAELADALYRDLRYDELETCLAAALRFAGEHGVSSPELDERAASLSLRRGRWQACTTGVAALRVRARRGERGIEPELFGRWRAARALGSDLTEIGAALAEYAWLTGQAKLADDVATVVVTPEIAAYCARVGITARAQPDSSPWSIGDWATAADLWELLGDPYERALALIDSGEAPRLRQALQILDTLGATAAATGVRRQLADTGFVPRGPRAETRLNPAGLTARQADVLNLVAEGLTNAEIAERLYLSVRTVDHHVAAILGKLGVSSRRHARAFALG